MRIRGQLFLLKISDQNSPETWTTVAGQRSGTKQITADAIETTSKDDSRWKKLLTTGLVGARIDARGLVTDAASYKLLCNLATQGTIRRFQLTFGNGLTITGPFQVEKWGGEGDYQDSQQYEISLIGAHDVEVPPLTPAEARLLINETAEALLLVEGGADSLLVAEIGVDEPSLSGRQLAYDAEPDLSNLLFLYPDTPGAAPIAVTVEDFLIAFNYQSRSVTLYDVPGTYDWDKPAGAKAIMVEVTGGGGGGAGGQQPSPGSGGGGGGGGAAYAARTFVPDDVPDSLTVSVGSGGAGGTPHSQNSTGGGSSAFGALLAAYGGGAGGIGLSATGGGGGGGGGLAGAGANATNSGGGGAGGAGGGSAGGSPGTGSTPQPGADTLIEGGGSGGGSSEQSGGTAAVGGRAIRGAQGGGAGGGQSVAGKAGAGAFAWGGTSVAGGAINGNGSTLYPDFAVHMRGAGGGGGGGGNSGTVAGNGGRGQQPGGGGGGGGNLASPVVGTPGTGGGGGDGAVRVTVFF